MHACHKVLMEVGDSSASIIGDPQGILGQQLRPLLIHVIVIVELINY